MGRFVLVSCISLLFSSTVWGQDPAKESLAPCGAPGGISPWLRAHAGQLALSPEERTEDTLWVALQLSLLAKDNGTGHFGFDQAIEAFCRLNADFAPANIQFYLKNPVRVINNTSWYSHSTVPKGIEMMLTNNVDSALNCYLVSDPAGNCGYNLPYGGVAIAHSCANPTDHTWAHEVGHALSLPHPFIGWEGKSYNYSTPTPTQLTYDYTYFHDTIETQVPAPLDTALVELTDGSNCAIAADLICDTPPDYLSNRWNCNSQHYSISKMKDPNGVDFFSDGTLYMSYSDDACQSRFSPMEIAAMRANLMSEKIAWIAPAIHLPQVTEYAEAIEPAAGQSSPVSGTKLVWSSVPNATHYIVQASRLASFALREVDVLTTDTSVVLGNLLLNKTYFWRVKAINAWSTCANFNGVSSFLTVPMTYTYNPDQEGWRCYPSLIAAGQALHMEIPEKWRGETAQIRIFDVAGKSVWDHYLILSSPRIQLPLPSADWPSGLYYMVLTSAQGSRRQSLVLMR